MPFLKMLDGPYRLKPLEIELEITHIGKNADLCGAFTLRNKLVSGLHCTVERTDEGYVIVDRGSLNKGSTNGTEVNGRRLEKLVPYPLRTGDEITIAKSFTFRFSDEDSESISGTGGNVMIGDSPDRPDRPGFGVKMPGSVHGLHAPSVATLESRLALITNLIESLRREFYLQPRCEQVLGTLLELLPAVDRGLLWIPKHRGLREGLSVARRRPDSQVPIENLTISPEVHQAVFVDGCAVQTKDQRILCAPLLDCKNRILGCVQLESLNPQRTLAPQDLDLLHTAAHLVSFAVDVALLQQVEHEMTEGRKIVEALLPASTPDVPGYEFFKFYKPASFVGGDYFDFIRVSEQCWVVPIADVSGKQLPASIFMTKVAGELRSLLDIGLPLPDIAARLNRRLCTQDEKTVTLLLLRLDVVSHELSLVNAGHCTPYLRTADGQVREFGVGKHGCLLGGMEDWVYEEFQARFEPGDTLILYTDGCTDAENDRQERYHVIERPRLSDAIAAAFTDVAELGERIRADIERFVGQHDQFDDMCLVGIRRRK